ncbi:MAG: hypothetical protein AB8G11_26400 [Saprospiraceae bacterium]
MRFIIFLMFILTISACCDDNYDCTSITNYPDIFVEYEYSATGFSRTEIDSSFIVVMNDSTNLNVDTLPYSTYSEFGYNIDYNDELWNDRDMRKHSYIIHIAQQIDTIHNIQYRAEPTIRECHELCTAFQTFEVEIDEFYDFEFDFNTETQTESKVLISK